MEDMNALERQVADGLGIMGGPGRRIDAMAMARTAATTTSPKWRLQSMVGATRFIVAGAIVALFGGLLLAGVLTQPSDEPMPVVGASNSPEPSPTQARIELPAEIPAGVESGRMDTPIGPARWVHLSGTADTLPDILEPVAVPGGYVSLDGPPYCESDPCGGPGTLWFSPDLLEWTPRPLPIERGYGLLTASGGGYWLTVNSEVENEDRSFDPPTLWRSTDALDWGQVDLSGVAPPPPSGIEWREYVGGVAVHGDTVATTISYEAKNTGSFLGLPAPPDVAASDWWVALEAADDGVYRVLDGWGMELDRIRIAPIDGGLQIADAGTGDAISAVEGAGMEFIGRWAALPGGPSTTGLWWSSRMGESSGSSCPSR